MRNLRYAIAAVSMLAVLACSSAPYRGDATAEFERLSAELIEKVPLEPPPDRETWLADIKSFEERFSAFDPRDLSVEQEADRALVRSWLQVTVFEQEELAGRPGCAIGEAAWERMVALLTPDTGTAEEIAARATAAEEDFAAGSTGPSLAFFLEQAGFVPHHSLTDCNKNLLECAGRLATWARTPLRRRYGSRATKEGYVLYAVGALRRSLPPDDSGALLARAEEAWAAEDVRRERESYSVHETAHPEPRSSYFCTGPARPTARFAAAERWRAAADEWQRRGGSLKAFQARALEIGAPLPRDISVLIGTPKETKQ